MDKCAPGPPLFIFQASALAPTPTLNCPAWGRYVVVRKIGTGSYGSAYLVKLKVDRRGPGGPQYAALCHVETH